MVMLGKKTAKSSLESICSYSFPKKPQAELDFKEVDFNDFPKGELWEFELDLIAKTVIRKKLEERGCEFPSVNPAWIGKENRYLYMSVCDSPTANGPLQSHNEIRQRVRRKTGMECGSKRISRRTHFCSLS